MRKPTMSDTLQDTYSIIDLIENKHISNDTYRQEILRSYTNMDDESVALVEEDMKSYSNELSDI